MGHQSPSEIVKRVAWDLRSLPETFRERTGGAASRKAGFSLNAPGGRLVARAIEAGAFSEAKYVCLRTYLEEDKARDATHWQGTFWVDACMHLLPEVALDPHKTDLQSDGVFSAIADLIEREAAKVEKAERRLAESRPAVPDREDERAAGFLSPADLARKYGVPLNPLQQRLKRWRRQNGEGWVEVPASDRKPRDPHFLYQVDAVRPVLESMKSDRRTSGEKKPAKKNA